MRAERSTQACRMSRRPGAGSPMATHRVEPRISSASVVVAGHGAAFDAVYAGVALSAAHSARARPMRSALRTHGAGFLSRPGEDSRLTALLVFVATPLAASLASCAPFTLASATW